MNYSVSTASKASSGASASTTTTLVTEATSLLFVVAFVMAVSAFYGVSTPATLYAPSIIFVTAVYVYAAAVKVYTSIAALMSWAAFKIVWAIVDVAIVIDKAIRSSVGLSSSTVATDEIEKSDDKSDYKSIHNGYKKTVRFKTTVDMKLIKPASEMTKEEKDAMGYNNDFLTKFRLKNAPEPTTPDAPRKVSRGPRLVIALPVALFSDEEEVEDPLDSPFKTDDDYDDYDSIGTLSDLDLWDDYDGSDGGDNDGGDGGESGEYDDVRDAEEESSESEVDAVSFANDDLGADAEESCGANDEGTDELEVGEDFKSLNVFQKFDVIEEVAKSGNVSTSFGSTIVTENGRNVRRSRRTR